MMLDGHSALRHFGDVTCALACSRKRSLPSCRAEGDRCEPSEYQSRHQPMNCECRHRLRAPDCLFCIANGLSKLGCLRDASNLARWNFGSSARTFLRLHAVTRGIARGRAMYEIFRTMQRECP